MAETAISRRRFLRGAGVAGASVSIGLPALDAMFNSRGTAYAATAQSAAQAIPTRFVLWFNVTALWRSIGFHGKKATVYVDALFATVGAFSRGYAHPQWDRQSAARVGAGNGHHNSMSGLVAGESFTGRGAGGPSIDQVIAEKIGRNRDSAHCRLAFAKSHSVRAFSAI